jgi:endonuclease/exonuclease/phosphatase family metal-dependent hydrolase
LLLTNIIFVVIWLFRKSLFAFISIIAIGLGWSILMNSIGFNAARTYTRKESHDAIRIMTYNVHAFKKYGSNNDLSTKHEILDIINLYQPDVLGIEEYYTKKRGEYAMTDSITRILNAHSYFQPLNQTNNTEAMGLAIFSKYKIINQGLIRLSTQRSGNQCIYVDVQKNGEVFRFYGVHLQSINFDPEDYHSIDSISKVKSTDMHSIKRIAGKLKRAFIKRSEQVKMLKQELKNCPYPYVIAGDFNDTPSSFAVNQLSKGLINAFRQKGNGLGRTYNGDFPNYQIDYILTTPHFSVTDYRVIEKKLSDHYPVYSDILLK